MFKSWLMLAVKFECLHAAMVIVVAEEEIDIQGQEGSYLYHSTGKLLTNLGREMLLEMSAGSRESAFKS